ncbi:alpha/beta fold hydrolase [Haloferula sp.]|uniref:alpha/beta fold hydrolase n=1 Tax=Haloferula sp. TaxID=2497595 RepID=UPI00329CDABE
MMKEPAKITAIDHLNASALMLVTPEYAELKRKRSVAGYNPAAPSFAEPPPMPSEFTTIQGVKTRFAHHSNEGRPTVVLLNPLPQSILAFAPMWASLCEKFEVYAYDLPGFGRSAGGVEFMNFKAQGEFLGAFISHFSIEGAHLVGPDIGMPTVLYHAATDGAGVRSVFVGDGPAISPSSNGSIINKMGYSSFWRLIMGSVGSGPFVEAGNRVGYVNYVPNATEISEYKESYAGRMPAILEWFKGYPESLASLDPLIGNIQHPTLLFWGRDDKLLLVDNGERLLQRIPGSRLHVFDHCGHFSYQDQYEEFRDLLVNWVEEVEGKA